MIIGVSGLIGSGKGALGDILHTKHGFRKISFAGKLKDSVSVLFGWDRDLLEGETKESREFREQEDTFWSQRMGYEVTPRKILQLVGTEVGRYIFHDKFWIYSIEKEMQEPGNYVITDLRFPNELDFIRSFGGFGVRVERGEPPLWYRTAETENNTPEKDRCFLEDKNLTMNILYPEVHISEYALIGRYMDYTIKNDGDLDYLDLEVNYMLRYLSNPDIMMTYVM
jgi:hypothetical protein